MSPRTGTLKVRRVHSFVCVDLRDAVLTGGHAGWDDCSDTPFLFNTSRKTVVTYDDTYSLGDKALFAKQNGMAGAFTWSLDQVRGYADVQISRSDCLL